MTDHHYRDLIRRAVLANDGKQLTQLIEQLDDAQRAREILRSKGYGSAWMNSSSIAAQVPEAPR